MIYGISDKPKTVKEWLLYAFQQLMSIFVATVLIANICGTPISSCLFGAGIGTLVYQLITKGKSPMFISSCGATVSAVIGALALGSGNNYFAVTIGGAVIAIIYILFAIIVKLNGVGSINKIFPPTIVGAVTVVIGLNLAKFIPTYVLVNGEHNNIAIAVAIITMLIVAVTSHYFKGFWKTIPFLIGLMSGYILAVILTLTGVAPLVDFSVFKNVGFFAVPDFTFKYWAQNSISAFDLIQIIILFVPVSICALLEHYSDHKVLSNIIGTDLTETPGLHRTLIGDGTASFVGTILCGLPNTSYGESIATTGFSKVASTAVISLASIMLIIMSFLAPVQAFLLSIPSCVFGGCAMVLYGYIAMSGVRTLLNNKVDFNNNKNVLIVCVILTVGVSGMFFLTESLTGTSLAMILGVILNLILKNKN